MFLCAATSVGIVFFIVLTMAYEGYPAVVEWFAHGFGMTWNPSAEEFGIIPYIFSTLYVGAGGMIFAALIGIPSAIYLAEFSSLRLRNIIKPSLEMLTGLPSIVIGIFGFVVVVTIVARYFGGGLGMLAAWAVLAIMSLPHIASISEDALRAVPDSYREASLALGATKWQTTRYITVPAAKSGILASLVLALGNAVGETMAVLMVVGAAMNPPITFDPTVSSNVITALIAREYSESAQFTGDPHWQALFGVGLVLFVIVAILNAITSRIVKGTKKK